MSHGDLSYFDFKPDSYDEEEFRWEEKRVKHGFKRPVIIHRAILGSLERFIALMTEHFAEKWPFWISPR
jgi:threonyl-tRNA synthetase